MFVCSADFPDDRLGPLSGRPFFFFYQAAGESFPQRGPRWPIVPTDCHISGSAEGERGGNAPWNPMNAPPVKAVDVYVSPNEIGGKWLLKTGIPANW